VSPEIKNQSLVEGSFLAALTALLILLGLYVPPLFPVAGLAGPLPLAVLVRRRDLRTGVLALVVAALLVFVLFGRPFTVLVLVVQIGPLGLLLGLLYKKNVSAGLSVAVAGVVSALLFLLTAVISFAVTGVNPLVMGPEMRRSMEQVLAWYQRRGLIDAASLQQLKQAMEQAVHLMGLLLPANLLIWSLISVFISYVLGRLVLKKLGCRVVPLPPFSRWQFPWYLVWGVILGLGFVLGGDALQRELLSTAGKNLLYVSGFIYLVAGLSTASFHVRRRVGTKFFQYLLIVLVLIYWPFALTALCALGLIDSLIDTRHISGPAKGEKR